MDRVAIQCKGISKSYGSGENKVHALKSTHIHIDKGQLTLLVGPSGSGKTTLISIIATILTADSGELILLDHHVQDMTEIERTSFRRQHIGFVFQSLFLIPTLTIAENVALPLIVGGMKENLALERALQMLEKFHLHARAHVTPTALSKGQQQRIAIARAMINEASIIICDEPTSSLDAASGAETMQFLKLLAKDPTKAVLVVTHDERVFQYADRVIAMSDGQITRMGA